MNTTEQSPLGYFKHCVTAGYVDFDGRARRAEYWYFSLFSSLLSIPLTITLFVGILAEIPIITIIGGIIFTVYAIGIILPSIAVTVRRLHDTNKSGWFYLIGIIPFGGIVLFVFSIMEGDRGANLYGPDPKQPYTPDVTEHLQYR